MDPILAELRADLINCAKDQGVPIDKVEAFVDQYLDSILNHKPKSLSGMIKDKIWQQLKN
jgi:hypothetical protein